MTAANDLRIVEMLAGATFGPGTTLTLPSGLELDSSAANTVVNPDAAVEYVGRHRLRDPDETEILPPIEWPTEEDLTEGEFSGELPAIEPASRMRRLVRRLKAVRWSGTRVTAAVSSGLVLVGTGAGALWQVIQ